MPAECFVNTESLKGIQALAGVPGICLDRGFPTLGGRSTYTNTTPMTLTPVPQAGGEDVGDVMNVILSTLTSAELYLSILNFQCSNRGIVGGKRHNSIVLFSDGQGTLGLEHSVKPITHVREFQYSPITACLRVLFGARPNQLYSFLQSSFFIV